LTVLGGAFDLRFEQIEGPLREPSISGSSIPPFLKPSVSCMIIVLAVPKKDFFFCNFHAHEKKFSAAIMIKF
jgi:hypothetical protein